MAGLKTMVTDMTAVVISAVASPGSTQVRAALAAILNAMENSGDLAGNRVDVPRKLWEDLRAARLTYRYAEAPDSTGNDLAGLATAITASVIPGPQYGAIAVRNALAALLNGWENSGDAGRVDTARSRWLALHDARRLYQAERYGQPVGGLLRDGGLDASTLPGEAPAPKVIEDDDEPESKHAHTTNHHTTKKHR